MTIRYLVDTDWVISYLSGQARVISRLDELKEEGLGVSVVSLAELYEGISCKLFGKARGSTPRVQQPCRRLRSPARSSCAAA